MRKFEFSKKTEIVILSIILLFALIIRVYSLGVPPFWVDESISALTAKSIIDNNFNLFNPDVFGVRALFFHYLQAFFLLFGQTEFLARFISVLFGLLTIVLAWFIGREYSKYGGILAALFTAIFYLEVFYSRQSRMYQLFQLLFFLSIYLLYKSKENPKYLYFALISLVLAVNTQIQGLILTLFFIGHILMFNKKQKFWAIIPAFILIYNIVRIFGLPSDNVSQAVNYASQYFSFASSIVYLLILAVPGIVWAFMKQKRLTVLLVVPSIITLIGIFSLQTFAFRYSYFFFFIIVLYPSLFLSFSYEKFGSILLIAILAMIIIPSNLIYPATYVNVLKPIDYNFDDFSAPEINYKSIPQDLVDEIRNSDDKFIVYFSPHAEWYIKKPDYVVPFSLDGRGNDSISVEIDGKVVDVYSKSPILEDVPEESYYFIVDLFSLSKLKPDQIEFMESLIEGCSIRYENSDLRVFYC